MLFQLELTVRAPIHIGSGGALLRRGIDFATFGRFLYMLNLDAVLDYIVPLDGSATRIDEIMRSQNLASFLTQADVQQHPELYHYRLGGAPTVSEVRPQIKNVHAQPYIPGSTVKGAIRTALASRIGVDEQINIEAHQLGRSRELAARGVEQSLFGRTPNYDLLRVLQVADTEPSSSEALELQNVAVWPAGQRGIRIDIEALRPGTTVTTRLKLDEYLLSAAARNLNYGDHVTAVRQWVAICREHGMSQMRQEAAFFDSRAPSVERFYAELLREAVQSTDNSFFVQLGWGVGWDAKTLSRIIKPNRELLANIVQRYGLTSGNYQPGTPFPKTRHVVADRGQPVLPLGWVQIRVREE